MFLPTPFLLLLLSPLAALASPAATIPLTDVTGAESAAPKDYPNRLLMIRHGEKPPHGAPGLSPAGKRRAQCLRSFMGRKSKHSIGLIMAESYNPRSHVRARPFLTVEPLAKDLGLTVDVSCERDDALCVRRVVEAFAKRSNKDILICWKHSELAALAQALGATRMTPYPVDRFDIMWVLKHKKLAWKESEQCKGIDDHLPRYDPDLETEVEDIELEDDVAWDDADQLTLGSN